MAELKLLPIHTRILTHHDNIVDAILEYAGDKITDHDIVCSAESVVAITQNRYVRPEELNVCWQARLMNRFVPSAGSMASIYGMQAAMDEEGKWNMLFSFALGAVAKIFGKNGVFYARCRQASLIDDVTGTMPPFDKCLVYGPADTDNVCEKIKKATGAYGAVIADVNDLKRAAVLGKSQGLDPKQIAKILIDNPFGNDNQKTPSSSSKTSPTLWKANKKSRARSPVFLLLSFVGKGRVEKPEGGSQRRQEVFLYCTRRAPPPPSEPSEPGAALRPLSQYPFFLSISFSSFSPWLKAMKFVSRR